ncbi:hypothetical protein MBRU_09285 [Mycolicibacterium brumae DSM 44177]|nr:hypothetical protein MBRU_09285 [Mycolicibacterium brumae DSM 44177]
MSSPMTSRTRSLIALGALALVAALVVAAIVLLPKLTAKQMRITANFADAVGLYVGNQVAVLGMTIGKVESVTPRGEYVEVVMAIDPGVDIPVGAQAVTVSTSILTDRHVELTPAYTGGEKLADGAVIELKNTRTPVEFERTLAMVDKLGRAMNGDGDGGGPLADLITIGADIGGNGEQIKDSLGRLSEALRLSDDKGAQTHDQLTGIIDNLAVLVDAAAQNDSQIREFGSSLRQVSDTIAAQDLGSGTTGAKINEILQKASSLLEKNKDKITSAAKTGRDLTNTIVDLRRDVAEMLDVAPLALDNVYNAIDYQAGAVRFHILVDKLLFNGQFTKEVCNLMSLKQLGCATGTLRDYGPDFGLNTMFEFLAGAAN